MTTEAVAFATACERAELVLAAQVVPPELTPLYSAVMLCGLATADRADVVHVAWLEPFSATALQTTVAPSLKVTVPLAPGSPAAALTVAVKVTLCPYVLGLLLLTTLVVVGRVVAMTEIDLLK